MAQRRKNAPAYSFGAKARSALTAAHSAEWAIAMVKCATRLSHQQVLALLKESARNTLDVLREKPKHSKPTLGQLREDSAAVVQTLIKLVMSKTDKTVVVICTGAASERACLRTTGPKARIRGSRLDPRSLICAP